MGNVGVYVVHLAEPVSGGRLTYRQGSVVDGYANVRKLVESASRNDIPVLFSDIDDEFATRLTAERLYKGIKGLDYRFHTLTMDDFIDDPLASDWISDKRIDRLVLAGFNRGACVKAVFDRAMEIGVQAKTTDDLLFGNCMSDSEEFIFRALSHYRINDGLYENLDEVLSREINGIG